MREQKARKAQLDKYAEFEHPLPEGSNRELYDVFFAALKEKKAKWMDESEDYCRSDFHLLNSGAQTCSSIRRWYPAVQLDASRRRVLFMAQQPCLPPPSWHYRYDQVFIRLGVHFVISPPHSRRLTGPSTNAKVLAQCSLVKALRMQTGATQGRTLKLRLPATSCIYVMAGNRLMRL